LETLPFLMFLKEVSLFTKPAEKTNKQNKKKTVILLNIIAM